jgi:hypothetical protein
MNPLKYEKYTDTNGVEKTKEYELTKEGNRHIYYLPVSAEGVCTPDLVTIDALQAQQDIKIKSQDSIAYLQATDWYVIRKMETGIIVPTEVTSLREAARLNIE